MTLLSELYQEVILDHNRHPRNYGELTDATSQAEGYNPLCGDKVRVYLKLNGDVIEKVGFEGTGCAISTASASIMTEVLKGRTVSQADELFQSPFYQEAAKAVNASACSPWYGSLERPEEAQKLVMATIYKLIKEDPSADIAAALTETSEEYNACN